MLVADHLAVLERDGAAIYVAADRVGLAATVPTCPGWQMRDLLSHLGGVHRWATSYVRGGRPRPYPAGEEAVFFPTVADGDLLNWFQAGHRALLDAITAADPDLSCWAFLPASSPLAFWARRQAHETAIHRADAEAAIPAVPDWSPDFAADGIDELLNGFFSRRRGKLVADPPVSMAVVATDTDVAWTIRVEQDRRLVVPGAQPADLTVSGPVRDLYLLLWNRAGTQRLRLRGERSVLELWRNRATVTLD